MFPADWANGLPAAKSASVNANVGVEVHSLKELLSKSKHGARFDCVECHQYHNRAQEKLNGHFGQP